MEARMSASMCGTTRTSARKSLLITLVVAALVGVVLVRKKGNFVERRNEAFSRHGRTYTCSVGMFVDPKGCLFCPLGHYCNQADLAAPKQCGIGTFQDKIGQAGCQLAPAGSYAGSKGMIAAKKCLPGTFQADAGQASCVAAQPGTFVSTAGQTKETNCPPNFYQTQSGKTSCVPCPKGEVQPLPGQSSCSCAASKSAALAARIRTNTLSALTHLANKGCPGILFLHGGWWYAAASLSCASYKSGTKPKTSQLFIKAAYWSDISEEPHTWVTPLGTDRVRVHKFECNFQKSCSGHGHWDLGNANRFYVVFPANDDMKKYTAMTPTYAQALSWAKQGYAPKFRGLHISGQWWWYFTHLNAMMIQGPTSGKHYRIWGTFEGQHLTWHMFRMGLYFLDGHLKVCCGVRDGRHRRCVHVNQRLFGVMDCKPTVFEFLV